MKLKGSESEDPAIRAAALAEQFREALWAAHQAGTPVPTGPVELSFTGDTEREFMNLKQFVFGGQAR